MQFSVLILDIESQSEWKTWNTVLGLVELENLCSTNSETWEVCSVVKNNRSTSFSLITLYLWRKSQTSATSKLKTPASFSIVSCKDRSFSIAANRLCLSSVNCPFFIQLYTRSSLAQSSKTLSGTESTNRLFRQRLSSSFVTSSTNFRVHFATSASQHCHNK